MFMEYNICALKKKKKRERMVALILIYGILNKQD